MLDHAHTWNTIELEELQFRLSLQAEHLPIIESWGRLQLIVHNTSSYFAQQEPSLLEHFQRKETIRFAMSMWDEPTGVTLLALLHTF